MTIEAGKAQALVDATEKAKRSWRRAPNGYKAMMDAYGALQHYGAELAAALPFGTSIAYAYSPNQGPTSRGKDHICPAEDISIGRLTRKAGQPICSTQDFWGLEPGLSDQPTCQGCIKAAERIVVKQQKGKG
jgi:hypothetical protein